MTGLGDIIRDAGEQAATLGVDLGDFLSGVWDWAADTFSALIREMSTWDWGNISGGAIILAVTVFLAVVAARWGKD